jgi:hypothetical protein
MKNLFRVPAPRLSRWARKLGSKVSWRDVSLHAIDEDVDDITFGEHAGGFSVRNWRLKNAMYPIAAHSVFEANIGRIQTNSLALLHTAAVVRLANLSNELDVQDIGDAGAVLAI